MELAGADGVVVVVAVAEPSPRDSVERVEGARLRELVGAVLVVVDQGRVELVGDVLVVVDQGLVELVGDLLVVVDQGLVELVGDVLVVVDQGLVELVVDVLVVVGQGLEDAIQRRLELEAVAATPAKGTRKKCALLPLGRIRARSPKPVTDSLRFLPKVG